MLPTLPIIVAFCAVVQAICAALDKFLLSAERQRLRNWAESLLKWANSVPVARSPVVALHAFLKIAEKIFGRKLITVRAVGIAMALAILWMPAGMYLYWRHNFGDAKQLSQFLQSTPLTIILPFRTVVGHALFGAMGTIASIGLLRIADRKRGAAALTIILSAIIFLVLCAMTEAAFAVTSMTNWSDGGLKSVWERLNAAELRRYLGDIHFGTVIGTTAFWLLLPALVGVLLLFLNLTPIVHWIFCRFLKSQVEQSPEKVAPFSMIGALINIFALILKLIDNIMITTK